MHLLFGYRMEGITKPYILVALVTAFWMCSSANGQSTQSKTPGASGQAVATEVANLIKNSGIFRDDLRFMIRVAYVESKFGTDQNTYRAGYDGGIWQVDKIGFGDTQNTRSHPQLKTLLDKVKTQFGIDWTGVTWADLRKPLYSGIAARLFLANKPVAIPASVKDQAVYWKTYYNSNAGAGNAAKFERDVKQLEG